MENWLPNESMQSYILSFEMMAQLLVFILFRHHERYFRGIDISIETRLDNQAAEAILHQGFTQLPVPATITRACQTLAFQTRVKLNPFRASSTENIRADDLSRGRVDQEDPTGRLPPFHPGHYVFHFWPFRISPRTLKGDKAMSDAGKGW